MYDEKTGIAKRALRGKIDKSCTHTLTVHETNSSPSCPHRKHCCGTLDNRALFAARPSFLATMRVAVSGFYTFKCNIQM